MRPPDPEDLALRLLDAAEKREQVAVEIATGGEIDVEAVRASVRRLARERGIRIRTGLVDGALVVIRADAALWSEPAATMRQKLTPPADPDAPELTLMVGHVGAGKTTRAIALAAETGAVRLTPDEWMVPLFHHHDPDGMRDVLEGRLVWTAREVLAAGASVVLDFGLWGRDERAALAWLAASVGARARTLYLSIDPATQTERVARRWRETPERTWEVTQQELDGWRAQLQEPDAAELRGDYAPAPPGGGDWADWIAERWPTALDRP